MNNVMEEKSVNEEILTLRKELDEYKQKNSAQCKEILDLRKQFQECDEKVSFLEQENESLRRLINRSNQENDQLLKKFNSISETARILEDNESVIKEEIKLLREENHCLKQSVLDSNLARDNVIEKLKEVSLETRLLIDNCEKATEESRIYQMKSEDLEMELTKLKSFNENLANKCQKLESDIEQKNIEIEALQEKISSQGNMIVDDNILRFWKDDVPKANESLQKVDTQLRKLIIRTNESEARGKNLEEEVDRLKHSNVILQEHNAVKDDIITKQNQDFLKVKTTVDEYHAEILRLDSELKKCHERVSILNENLEMFNSENVNVAEYALFRRSLQSFNSLENIENLLGRLQVLQEIEQFFEKQLSPHVDPSAPESEKSDQVVTGSKENTINKIKNYLEKALITIEKLNDKMLRMRNEYEVKLRAKNAEIATLRDLTLSASMYNRILERSLQQFRENLQLDNTIEIKTNELLSVNATLMDSFDDLKLVYQTTDRCNSFLFTKVKQLKLLCKILQLTIRKIQRDHRKFLETDFDGLFSCVNEIFEEVDANEFRYKLSPGSESLLNLCESKVATNHYLKNMVENMSLEVKRLTSKVELEMAEKIQEIEILKGEMDSVRTDNRDLVCKIKNCNREIVSLSTDNYDLNEKLQCLAQIEQNYETAKRELTDLKNDCSKVGDEKSGWKTNWAKRVQRLTEVCHCLKRENESLKNVVNDFANNFNDQIHNIISQTVINSTTKIPDFSELWQTFRQLRCDHQNFKEFINDSLEEWQNDLMGLKNKNNEIQFLTRENLLKMYDSCRDLRQQYESLRNSCTKTSSDAIIFPAKSILQEKLSKINSECDELVANYDAALKTHQLSEKNIVLRARQLKSILDEFKAVNFSLHSLVKELPAEFSKIVLPVMEQMESALTFTVENMKASFAASNEEIIQEMQEMNLELKKRGSTISSLNQTLDDLEKEKQHILDRLQEKENIISDMIVREKNLQQNEREIQTYVDQLKLNYSDEMNTKSKLIEDLSNEKENLKSQLCAKDDVIASLEHEISKQREGDASSMGTISRIEEVSRLNDVEDSFEERYMKLRCIAVKMKKNIAELNKELKVEKAERVILQNKVQTWTEQAKRAQVLQEECDKLTDEVEFHQNEIKELKKIIFELDKENEILKLRCEELANASASSKTELASWMAEKKELETKLKTQVDQLTKTCQEKLAEEMIKKERDKEIASLREKLQQIEELNKKVLYELEQAKLEARKQGALTLEMKDYEKTISDLTNSIKDKENYIQKITARLDESALRNNSLIQQIEVLEEQVQTFMLNVKTKEEEMISLNKVITCQERNIESLEKQLKQAVHQLESERSKNESLVLKLSNSSAELKTVSESYRSMEKQLREQVKSLHGKLSEYDEKVNKSDNECAKLKDDFEAYKIRAHNALQKYKMENNMKNNEEKLLTEVSDLSQTLKTLRKQLDDALNEVDNHKAEINLLKTTKENLSAKVKELSEMIGKKSKEIDSVHAEYKAHKLNTDTLINCYKVEIEKLKALNEKLKNENVEIPTADLIRQNENGSLPQKIYEVDECCESDFLADNKSLHNLSVELPESEIEAIEETERYRKNSKHSLIPLDKLLEYDINESKRFGLSESELREHVGNLEQQIKYLTNILNESEKNAARCEQQVTFLKDEIRRLQRMFEREPHLQNTEYVKNVLLKFISLPCGDDKHRLITVLETILKLTPDEKQTLSAVAKGYRVDSKQPGSWTSFLGW